MLIDNIRLLSEMYDLGKKEVKIIKSEESQSQPIENMPFNALFIGSQENILYDESVKNKFKLEFTTKLARRSFFNFNKEDEPSPKYSSVDEMIKTKKALEESAIQSSKIVNAFSVDVANSGVGRELSIDEDAYTLFLTYMTYNEELSNSIANIYPISKLVRKHAQWRALKLAGAFATLDGKPTIDSESYCQAIQFVEQLDTDMVDFEIELSKEKYEVFADYMIYIAENNKSHITLHDMKKMGFIPSNSASKGKVDEMIIMANSYVDDGVFTRNSEDGVDYEYRERSDKVGAAYKLISGSSKKERAERSADGFKYLETSFEKLSILLSDDYSFLPFELDGGVRKKENVIGETKWLCLDVDDAGITLHEACDMLGDYKYHIAATSNPDNVFKFRVIVELDSKVNIKDKVWKKFVASIADELGLDVDLLPKAQVFFGYKDREVYSNLEGDVIETKKHIIKAMSTEKKEKPKTKAELSQALENKMDTFFYAFEAENGSRSLNLIRCAKHAYDLGASSDYITNLMFEINDYWIDPLEDEEIEKTIVSQIERWEYK